MTTRAIKNIADEVLQCALSHDPESRLIGNVRADELAALASCAADLRAENKRLRAQLTKKRYESARLLAAYRGMGDFITAEDGEV